MNRCEIAWRREWASAMVALGSAAVIDISTLMQPRDCLWPRRFHSGEVAFESVVVPSSVGHRLRVVVPSELRCVGALMSARASAKKDPRASATGGAVEVLTHHSAKGLEWPIVILTGLGSASRTALWDVRARSTGHFNAQEPLTGRFIHYWPKPYP